MTVYVDQSVGATLSQVVAKLTTQFEGVRSLERGATAPTVKPVGLLHDTSGGAVLTGLGIGLSEAITRWNGSSWTLFADPLQAQINAGGTIAFAADQPMGNHKFTGLAAGSAAGHSVRFEQVLLLSGANAMAGALDMGTHLISNVVDPVSAQDAATKAYVDARGSADAGVMYFQTNRDVRGDGHPVIQQATADLSGTYTVTDKTPRRLTVRLTGQYRKQSDNSVLSSDTITGQELTFVRQIDDAGGASGSSSQVKTFVSGATTFTVTVTWKTTAPYGYAILFGTAGNECFLKKIGAGGTDGSIQVLAEWAKSD